MYKSSCGLKKPVCYIFSSRFPLSLCRSHWLPSDIDACEAKTRTSTEYACLSDGSDDSLKGRTSRRRSGVGKMITLSWNEISPLVGGDGADERRDPSYPTEDQKPHTRLKPKAAPGIQGGRDSIVGNPLSTPNERSLTSWREVSQRQEWRRTRSSLGGLREWREGERRLYRRKQFRTSVRFSRRRTSASIWPFPYMCIV